MDGRARIPREGLYTVGCCVDLIIKMMFKVLVSLEKYKEKKKLPGGGGSLLALKEEASGQCPRSTAC